MLIKKGPVSLHIGPFIDKKYYIMYCAVNKVFILLLGFTGIYTYGNCQTAEKLLDRAIILNYNHNLFKCKTAGADSNQCYFDSLNYYYNYFLTNTSRRNKQFALGLFYAAMFQCLECNNYLKADSLFKEFLSLKKPKRFLAPDLVHYKNTFYPGDNTVLYYHYVYEALTEIHFQQQDYRNALKYIILDEKSTVNNVCGNQMISRDALMAHRKAKCYIALNQPDSVLFAVLPEIFNQYYPEKKELVALAAQLYKNKFKKDALNLVESAFRAMFSQNKGTTTECFIQLSGTEIFIPPRFSEKTTEMDYTDMLWNSDFYMLIKAD